MGIVRLARNSSVWGDGEELHVVAVGVVDADAPTTRQTVDGLRLVVPWIGPVGQVALLDLGEDGVALFLRDADA